MAKSYKQSARMLERLQKLVDVWDECSSLEEAILKAGWSSKDRRTHQRYKSKAQAAHGVVLPPHNPQFKSTYAEIECPSTLDVAKAKMAKCFVVSSATNNSNLNVNFWEALSAFSNHHDAQQLVIPLRYKHNTLIGKDDYEWDKRLHPYAVKDDLIIGKKLLISGARPQATAINPLTGLDSLGGPRSVVYGHPQIAMRSIATSKTEEPKVITTTGSVTSKKYTSTIAGLKGHFYHSFAAMFVYLKGNQPYHIHLHWDGKGFYFLGEYWTAKGLAKSDQPVLALVGGDTHIAWENKKHTTTRRRTIAKLNPDNLVWHDLHDHRYQGKYATRSERIELARSGKFLVEDELQLAQQHVNDLGVGRTNLIVTSNHDCHLDQWLDKFKPDHDPHNAYFAMKLHTDTIDSGVGAFQTWLAPRLKVKVKFLNPNEAYILKGVNLSLHGDKGANGSRGTLTGLGKLPVKVFIGHSHGAGINRGAYQVGCGTRAMKYAQGPSNWSLCDGILYANGKRGLLFYARGKSLVDFFG